MFQEERIQELEARNKILEKMIEGSVKLSSQTSGSSSSSLKVGTKISRDARPQRDYTIGVVALTIAAKNSAQDEYNFSASQMAREVMNILSPDYTVISLSTIDVVSGNPLNVDFVLFVSGVKNPEYDDWSDPMWVSKVSPLIFQAAENQRIAFAIVQPKVMDPTHYYPNLGLIYAPPSSFTRNNYAYFTSQLDWPVEDYTPFRSSVTIESLEPIIQFGLTSLLRAFA